MEKQNSSDMIEPTKVSELGSSEKRKIKCAEKHFQSINIGYTVLEKPEDITEICCQ